ncbi:ATP/GTP-binding protein [Streptomyces sp. NPDC058001]|uniref:ATP/GTP-binding protein n=1 Tax=Streptomyces sp. NPDC058001 TaxID=3346300 RepID=UPI0036EFE301
MSPRRNRPKASDPGGGDPDDERGRYGGFEGTETWQGEQWTVRHVAGASVEGKSYRCPGCDQLIPSGMPHVVVWPQHAGVDDRRHWHKACWSARSLRSARPMRGRKPRY